MFCLPYRIKKFPSCRVIRHGTPEMRNGGGDMLDLTLLGNCIGVELNDKRINSAISWLRKQGYDISAKNGMDASCENL